MKVSVLFLCQGLITLAVTSDPLWITRCLLNFDKHRDFFRFFGARLVHLLDHLEGQDDVADFVGLAVPDQLHLPVVVKKQKAIFVRQRFVCLQIANDVVLFLIRQSCYKRFLPFILSRSWLVQVQAELELAARNADISISGSLYD